MLNEIDHRRRSLIANTPRRLTQPNYDTTDQREYTRIAPLAWFQIRIHSRKFRSITRIQGSIEVPFRKLDIARCLAFPAWFTVPVEAMRQV